MSVKNAQGPAVAAGHTDTKALRLVADQLDGVQHASGHYAQEDQSGLHQGHGRKVRLNPNLVIHVRDEAEAKELIAKLDAAIAPLVQPYIDRYRSAAEALLHPKPKA